MSTRAKIEADLAKAEADLAMAATNLAKSCATHAETDVCLPKAFSNLAKEKVDLVKVDAELVKARASCRAARIELDRLNLVAGMPIGYRSEPTHIAHEAELELAPMDRRKASKNRRKAHSALSRAKATERMPGTDRRKASDNRRLARPGLANRNQAEMIAKSDGRTDKMLQEAISSPKLGMTASLSDRSVKSRSTQSNEHLGRTRERSPVRPSSRQNDDRRFISHFSAQDVSSKDKGAWQSLAWQAAELSTLTLAYLLYYYVDVNLQIVMLPPSVGSLLVG